MNLPSHLSIAQLPTPLQPLTRWSERLGGPAIWCKRDDLTGVLWSGNKVRKLEFVIQDALEHDARMLITCGGIQSNHARTTAALAAHLGLGCHLLLKGSEPDQPTGNFLLDRLFGAHIDFITADDYAQHSLELMEEVAGRYRSRGISAYVIPEGASCALGTYGYARVIDELWQQTRELDLVVEAIVCATGSGGTQAGLILGTRLTGWNVPVIGINICDDAGYFRQKISRLLQQVREAYVSDLDLREDDIHLIDGHVGEGYGRATTEELRTICELASLEGLILEPVYTGKAMHGLRQEIAAGRMKAMKNIVFIHTGGIFGLFPFCQQLKAVMKQDADLNWSKRF